jgi:hypothetical protein
MISLLDACKDVNLFAPWFRKRESWQSWFAFIASLFALPMTDEQLAIYRQCTGRDVPPSQVSRECWLVIGRRGGKSFMLALIAVFLACFHEYRQYLQPGERGSVLVMASTTKQARTILRYVAGLLLNVPMLKSMIERETADGFDLDNGTTIEIVTASYKSTRGYTLVTALCDEIAYWPTDDAADPDHEILNALRPAMATIPNAMLLACSSPYARKGELWNAHRQHFARDGDPVLCWHAPTRVMNPSVPQSLIDAATERDPAHAAAEYGAQFRTDIESYIKLDIVEACVALGITERAPQREGRFRAFCDPSGGISDSMTLAIAHREDQVVVLDKVIEVVPPFSPAATVAMFARECKRYRINAISGDRYAGEWPREVFRQHRIAYEPAAKSKSDLYVAFLPLLSSRTVELLDHPKLIRQIASLERRTARGGKDSIDHSPGAHDDISNAVAGVCALFDLQHSYDTTFAWVCGDDEADLHRQEQLRLNAYIMNGGFQ